MDAALIKLTPDFAKKKYTAVQEMLRVFDSRQTPQEKIISLSEKMKSKREVISARMIKKEPSIFEQLWLWIKSFKKTRGRTFLDKAQEIVSDAFSTQFTEDYRKEIQELKKLRKIETEVKYEAKSVVKPKYEYDPNAHPPSILKK